MLEGRDVGDDLEEKVERVEDDVLPANCLSNSYDRLIAEKASSYPYNRCLALKFSNTTIIEPKPSLFVEPLNDFLGILL